MGCATDNRRLRRRYSAIGLLAIALAATQTLGQWRDGHLVLINATDSLDQWAFLVDRRQIPERGDFAFFHATKTGFIARHFGRDVPPFGKRVYGVGGDMVSRTGDLVRINGRVVARLKPFTKKGEVLVPGPTGPVPQNCFYMGSPHRDGLDSRYAEIGFVCRDQLVGTGRAIL
jgi:conjugal transfer pilin signal peptidase TrbI